MFNNTGIAKNDRITGYITVYITIRSDQYIVAYCDISYDSRIDTDPYRIADYGCAFAFSAVFLTYHNTFVNIAVLSNHRIHVDRNIISMTQIQTHSNFCRR